MKRFASFALAAVLAATPALAGAQVFGTAADYSGTRSTPLNSGLVSAGDWGNFSVSWSIVQEGNLLRYTYTFSGYPSPGISHAIISLSPNCTSACASSPVWTFGETSVAGEIGSISTYVPGENGNSNVGLPNDLYGVKFNRPEGVSGGSPLVLTFLSERTPVWGNFYAKGGGDSYVYNTGLLEQYEGSSNTTFFIARPDTQPISTVPEPSTYALMATGLLGIGAAARRRRTA